MWRENSNFRSGWTDARVIVMGCKEVVFRKVWTFGRLNTTTFTFEAREIETMAVMSPSASSLSSTPSGMTYMFFSRWGTMSSSRTSSSYETVFWPDAGLSCRNENASTTAVSWWLTLMQDLSKDRSINAGNSFLLCSDIWGKIEAGDLATISNSLDFSFGDVERCKQQVRSFPHRVPWNS